MATLWLDAAGEIIMVRKEDKPAQLDLKIVPGLREPPSFCQYADGRCDQDFQGTPAARGIVLYPSEPAQIAATIEAAVSIIRKPSPQSVWRTWKEFQVAGQIIFCSICKSMRFGEYIVADVTTLNFNLLFEIGFALGSRRTRLRRYVTC